MCNTSPSLTGNSKYEGVSGTVLGRFFSFWVVSLDLNVCVKTLLYCLMCKHHGVSPLILLYWSSDCDSSGTSRLLPTMMKNLADRTNVFTSV